MVGLPLFSLYAVRTCYFPSIDVLTICMEYCQLGKLTQFSGFRDLTGAPWHRHNWLITHMLNLSLQFYPWITIWCSQHPTSGFLLDEKDRLHLHLILSLFSPCYGLSCVTSKFIWWHPNPNGTIFGDRVFKETIMIKWGHKNRALIQ